MQEENNSIGEFGFVIITRQSSQGNIRYQTKIVNKKVPLELIAMQMKAFLAQLEQDYLDTFNQRATFFREE